MRRAYRMIVCFFLQIYFSTTTGGGQGTGGEVVCLALKYTASVSAYQLSDILSCLPTVLPDAVLRDDNVLSERVRIIPCGSPITALAASWLLSSRSTYSPLSGKESTHHSLCLHLLVPPCIKGRNYCQRWCPSQRSIRNASAERAGPFVLD